jgi:hypothetical protein
MVPLPITQSQSDNHTAKFNCPGEGAELCAVTTQHELAAFGLLQAASSHCSSLDNVS